MPRNPDRAELCQFTFADGRRCTMPQFPDDVGFCYYHGQQRRDFFLSREAGRQVSRFLQTDIVTACDLSSTLSALFAATAEGHIKPKRAKTLAYLAAILLQSHKLAKQEFLETFDDTWPQVVSSGPSFAPPKHPSNPITPSLTTEVPGYFSPEPSLASESDTETTPQPDPPPESAANQDSPHPDESPNPLESQHLQETPENTLT